MVGKLSIGAVEGSSDGDYSAVLSLIFLKGQRPDASVLRTLADAPRAEHGAPAFTISHMSEPAQGWVELLAAGLTFDCAGLAPAASAPIPSSGALLGLEREPEGEVITLSPGPHIADAMGMLPVVRALAGIGSQLAALPGCAAVIWNPARCWMPPAYFCKVIDSWLADGPFPALGLTSLERESDGSIVSVGLALMIGQELRFIADSKLVTADLARIAVRLIHALIESGPLFKTQNFLGPDRETLVVSPNLRGTQLDVTIQR